MAKMGFAQRRIQLNHHRSFSLDEKSKSLPKKEKEEKEESARQFGILET